MEDWESVLSESPGQEQSILRLIMSDIEDPSLGLNTLLQSSSGSDHHHQNLEFGGGGFQDVVDQGGGYGGGFEPDSHSGSLVSPSLHASSGPDFNFSNNASNVETQSSNARPNPAMFSASMSNPFPVSLSSGMFQQQQNMGLDEKPQIFNPQMVINQYPNPLSTGPKIDADPIFQGSSHYQNPTLELREQLGRAQTRREGERRVQGRRNVQEPVARAGPKELLQLAFLHMHSGRSGPRAQVQGHRQL